MRIKHEDEPLGPANDKPLEVTQELVALLYAERQEAADDVPPVFFDGFFDGPPPDDEGLLAVWQSGALAAELMQLGGQR